MNDLYEEATDPFEPELTDVSVNGLNVGFYFLNKEMGVYILRFTGSSEYSSCAYRDIIKQLYIQYYHEKEL